MKFDFDNAGDIRFKIKQLKDGISRAKTNEKLFTQEVKKQVQLKKELEEELKKLEIVAEAQGIKLDEAN